MTVELDDVHLADLGFWERPPAERDEVFARLRATTEPVYVPENRGADGAVLPGFYALTRHDQVTEASRTPAVFSSEPSATSLDDPPPPDPRGMPKPRDFGSSYGHIDEIRVRARDFR